MKTRYSIIYLRIAGALGLALGGIVMTIPVTVRGATILGPSFPPDGGTVSFSSSGVAPGSAGGRNWNFADFGETTGWDALYWGPSSASLPSAGLDSSNHPLALSGISGTTATWAGVSSWTNPDNGVTHSNVPIELRVAITGLGASPWVLSSSIVDLDPGAGTGIGAVVDNTTGLDFTANFQFLADIPTDGPTGFIPINAVEQGLPGGQTRTSFGGGFYSVIPEPGTLGPLAISFLTLLLRRGTAGRLRSARRLAPGAASPIHHGK
jgi:hypothetical protein